MNSLWICACLYLYINKVENEKIGVYHKWVETKNVIFSLFCFFFPSFSTFRITWAHKMLTLSVWVVFFYHVFLFCCRLWKNTISVLFTFECQFMRHFFFAKFIRNKVNFHLKELHFLKMLQRLGGKKSFCFKLVKKLENLGKFSNSHPNLT